MGIFNASDEELRRWRFKLWRYAITAFIFLIIIVVALIQGPDTTPKPMSDLAIFGKVDSVNGIRYDLESQLNQRIAADYEEVNKPKSITERTVLLNHLDSLARLSRNNITAILRAIDSEIYLVATAEPGANVDLFRRTLITYREHFTAALEYDNAIDSFYTTYKAVYLDRDKKQFPELSREARRVQATKTGMDRTTAKVNEINNVIDSLSH